MPRSHICASVIVDVQVIQPDNGPDHSLDGAASEVDRIAEPFLAQKAARVIAWTPAQPTLAVETELADPDAYEIRV